MQRATGYDRFAEQVRARAGLFTKAEAERVLNAVLGAFGPRLLGATTGEVSAALPEPAASMLFAEDHSPFPVDYDREGLVDRVQHQLGVERGEAERGTAAVLSAVAEELGSERSERLRASLPTGLGAMLEPGSGASDPPLRSDAAPSPEADAR